MTVRVIIPSRRLTAALAATLSLLVHVAPAAPSDTPEEAIPIQVGQRLQAEIAYVDPFRTGAAFELSSPVSGPLTIEARSLQFDTYLRVSAMEPDGTASLLRVDEDAGPGTDSLLVLEAEPGGRYRIEVQPEEFPDCGTGFELVVSPGRHRAPYVNIGKTPDEEDAAAAYWESVLSEADARESIECRIRGLLGQSGAISSPRGVWRDEGRVLSGTESALELAERELDPSHPLLIAAVLARAKAAAEAADDFLGGVREAKGHYERALRMAEERLGPDHYLVARAVRGVWVSMRRLNMNPEEYVPLLEHEREILERYLGRDHPRLAFLDLLLSGHGLMEEEEAERAAEILERLLPPDHPYREYLLWSRGPSNKWEDAVANVRRTEEVLGILENAYGPDSYRLSWTLRDLGFMHLDLGDIVRAVELRKRDLEVFRKHLGRDHPDQFVNLANFAEMLRVIGEYQAAGALLERSLRLLESDAGLASAYMGPLLLNLAEWHLDLDHAESAREFLGRAVAIRDSTPEKREDFCAHAVEPQLVNLQIWLGEPLPEIETLEECMAVCENLWGQEISGVGRFLNTLGWLCEVRGDHAKALHYYERAVALAENGPRVGQGALNELLLHLSRMQATTGDVAAAFRTASRSETITREYQRLVADSAPERLALRYVSRDFSGLDLLLALAGDHGAELPGITRQAWDALIRNRGIVLDAMIARQQAFVEAAAIARLYGELTEATTRCANVSLRQGGSEIAQSVCGRRERVEKSLSDVNARFRAMRERATLGWENVSRSLPAGSGLLAYAVYWRPTIAPPVAAGTPNGSRGRQSPTAKVRGAPVRSYMALFMKSGDTEPVAVDLGPAATIESLVGSWQEETGQSPQETTHASPAGPVACRRAGEALRGKIWDPVAESVRSVRRLFVVPDGALNLVSLSALPTGSREYLLETAPVIHYFSSEKDLIDAGPAPRGRGSLLALGGADFDATHLFAAMEPRGPGTQAPVAEAQISSLLQFRGERSGCGEFHSVRFDALPSSAVEAGEVASLWKRTSPGGRPDGGIPPGAAGAEQESPGARTDTLFGASANESAFKSLAPGRTVLHLATHGFFLGGSCPSMLAPSGRGFGQVVTAAAEEMTGSDRTAPIRPGGSPPSAPSEKPSDAAATPFRIRGENPLVLSGLALAGANHREHAGENEDDGILTAQEIAAMDLSSVEWAVLSACDTGVGEVQAGEGVLGLRRAFQIAGAGAVIMSLWSVEDESARAWMKALYEGRLVKDLDTAEAVRQASLTVLNDRRARGLSEHPFYWAGFVAAGDWR